MCPWFSFSHSSCLLHSSLSLSVVSFVSVLLLSLPLCLPLLVLSWLSSVLQKMSCFLYITKGLESQPQAGTIQNSVDARVESVLICFSYLCFFSTSQLINPSSHPSIYNHCHHHHHLLFSLFLLLLPSTSQSWSLRQVVSLSFPKGVSVYSGPSPLLPPSLPSSSSGWIWWGSVSAVVRNGTTKVESLCGRHPWRGG